MDEPLGAFLAPLTAGNPWDPSPDAVIDALDAASAAGYAHVGISAVALGVLDRVGLDAAAELSARQLTVSCVEALFAWDSTDDAASAELEAIRLAADRLGATRVMAVTLAPALTDRPAALDRLGRAVDRLSADGRSVVVEFLPWTAIPTIAEAWTIVEPLGPSAGILLDTWHWFRQPGGPDLATLATIPGERIGLVQLCDVGAPTGSNDPGELMAEAMGGRLDPGDGLVDLAEVLACLTRIGATPAVTSEVFNTVALASRGARRRAQETADACRAVLRSAAASRPGPSQA